MEGKDVKTTMLIGLLCFATGQTSAQELSFETRLSLESRKLVKSVEQVRAAAAAGIAAQTEGRVLLTELKPGAKVTLSRALSEQIARDDSSFSLTTFINGIKVDLENLRGAIGAALIPGPGLWAAVNTVPNAARGKCAAAPAEKILSLVAVRLSETNGNGASLVLDFGGRACVASITLRIIQGASRAPVLRGVTVKDLEESFGVDADGVSRLAVTASGKKTNGPF